MLTFKDSEECVLRNVQTGDLVDEFSTKCIDIVEHVEM